MNRWKEFNFIVDNMELNIKEKGLLLVIFRYINCKNGYANPSRALIKKLTGIVDNRTLDNLFNALIKKDFLLRESGKKGLRSKYFIKINYEKIALSEENTSDVKIVADRCEFNQKAYGEITPQKENKKEKKYLDLYFIDEVIDKVEITKEQYDKLVNKFGSYLVNTKILEFDNYLSNNELDKYKDHYKILNIWCNKKNFVQLPKQINIDNDGIREFV